MEEFHLFVTLHLHVFYSPGLIAPRTSPVGPRSTISPVASPFPGGAAGNSGASPFTGGAAGNSGVSLFPGGAAGSSGDHGGAGDSGALVLGRSDGGALTALTALTTADSLISKETLQDALEVKQPGFEGLVGTFQAFSHLMAGSINHVANRQGEDRAKIVKLEEENAELRAGALKQREEFAEMKEDTKLTKEESQLTKEAIEALSSKVDNIGGSKFRESKIGCKVYPLLQRMLDGVVGIAGWVPVDHYTAEDSLLKLVVLSVPVMKYLLILHDKTLANVDLDSFLKGAFERYEFPEYTHHKMDIREFVKLLLKTPFKKYLVAPNSPTTLKNNLSNYIIMDQEYWRKLLADILAEFGKEASGELSDEAVVPDGCMIQDWALTKVSRKNPSAEGRSTHIDLLGRKLTEEERKACPPMNATWSREAYGGMKGFFGMPEGGPKRHVQSGVYDPNNKMKVPTFAQCFKDLSAEAVGRADAKRQKALKAAADAKRQKASKAAASKAPASAPKGKGKAPASSTKGKAPASPSRKKRPRSSQEDDEEVDVEGNTTKKKKKKFKTSQKS